MRDIHERERNNYLRLSHGVCLRRLGCPTGNGPLIVFFPFVGGNSLSFKALADALPASWQLWGVDPPGHGWSQGTLLQNFDDMVHLYLDQLAFLWNNATTPFYFFGHSLGGLMVYRMAQKMQAQTPTSQPAALFISAAPLAHRISEYEYLGRKKSRDLMETMAQFGGVPKSLTESEAFLLHYAAPLEADIQAFLSCKIDRTPPVTLPMIVLYSPDDLFLPVETVYEWDIYGSRVMFQEVAGNHIFVQSHASLVAQKIGDFIGKKI